MKPYHKIPTVFKRDPKTKYKTLLSGAFSTPELKYLKDNTWVFTEKVDGMNIRICCNPNGAIVLKGRTDDAQLPAKLVQCLYAIFTPLHDQLAKEFPDGACFYGEGYGAGIQKGGDNYRATQDFVLFDIRMNDIWLQRVDVEEIANHLELSIVPDIGIGTLGDMLEIVKGGFTSAWGNFEAEGIVARPEAELCTRRGERIICKLKCKDFK